MADERYILLETDEFGVATLTLNRPDAMNAFDPTMDREFHEAMWLLYADEAVRVIVVTGAGDGFCAGGDVKVMARGESIFGPRDDAEARRTRHAAAQRARAFAVSKTGGLPT